MSVIQQLEDARLLREAQQGNVEAFGVLYERYVQAVYRFLYAHLNNYLDAEDITSEVFLRAWRSLSRYRERGVPFLAYLLRIARNALVDFYRRSGSASQASLALDEVDRLPAPNAELAEGMANRIAHQELRSLLRQLPQDYQMVLVLRFLNALSPEETAQVLGRSASAVRVLQHRALAALRALIPEEPGR